VIGTLVTGVVYVEPGADEQLLWVKVPLGTEASLSGDKPKRGLMK
jgi:hypothetical protein